MSNSISGNSLRGHLETMILSVLEDQQAHGFEVLRRLNEAGCGSLQMKEGSLYPALYRLENQGLVEARWEEGDNNRHGPRRRLYKLTRRGRTQLKQGREHWAHFVTIIGGIVGAQA